MKHTLLALSCATLLLAHPLSAQPPTAAAQTTASGQSQNQAHAVVRRAADALGGVDALLAMTAIKSTLRGEATYRLQSTTPEPPFEPSAHDTDLLLDLANKRLSFRSADDDTGNIRKSLTLLGEGEPRIYNLHACTYRPFASPPSFDRELAGHARRLPHLLLRDALSNRLSLRYLGSAAFDGRPHEVVAFTMTDGVSTSMYVDRASGLISKAETLYRDTLAGVASTEIIFGDYTGGGLAKVPRTLLVREAGQDTLRARLTVEINPLLDAQAFAVGGDYLEVGASRPSPERVEELAKGIFVLHSVSDPQHNALAVEFDRYVLAVDAPFSIEGGQRLIDKIRTLIPDKPIRFLALTHHHEDHIGGLRSFVAAGTRVITTPGNRGLIEAIASAPDEAASGMEPQSLHLEMVADRKRVLTDGKRTVELIDIGPAPHAREMLVAYVPEERILYQSDLFIVPSNEAPVGTPTPSLMAFADAINRLGLNVERIAGGHGRTASLAEFRQRLNYRQEQDCRK